MENENTITRREFLKLAGSAVLGSFMPKEILDVEESKDIKFLEDAPDEYVPYSSILSSLGYEYSENEEQQFIQNYLFHLGISNLDKQDTKDFTVNRKLSELFDNRYIWEEIPPGTVMNVNGSSSVFLGLDKNRFPIFSSFSWYGGKQPEIGLSLLSLRNKYYGFSGDTNVSLFDAVDFSRHFDTEGNDILPDFSLFKELGYDVTVVLNINDGSLSMWDINNGDRINDKRMFCVVGRRLKRNEFLSKDYLENMWKYMPFSVYDSAIGCHIEPNGVRRKTYTPPIITEFLGTTVVYGFGGLGPDSHTDISMLRQVYIDKDNKPIISSRYSSYTLHEVPRGTNDQSILMREPQLMKANKIGLPIENPNLSAGCVNMDGDTWDKLKKILNSYLHDDKRVSVMFTTPATKQLSLLRHGSSNSHFHSDDPFGAKSRLWGYGSKYIVGLDKKNDYRGNTYALFPNRL